jgi:hypothetical protein
MGWVAGWVLTLVGPALYAARGFLPGVGFVRAVKVAVYVVCLGVGAWGGAWAMKAWQGDKLTQDEARIACDMTVAEATIAAKLKAVDDRVSAVRARELTAATDELRIVELMRTLQEARDAAKPDDDPIVFSADDEWLRRYRGAQVDRPRRR